MNDKEHDSSIRPAVRVPVTEFTPPEQESLKPAIMITDADFDRISESTPADSRQMYSGSRKLFWFVLLLVLVSVVQLLVSLYSHIQTGAWLGVAWLILLATGGIAVFFAIAREWRAFSDHEKRRYWREESRRLANSPAIGEAQEYCQDLANQLPDSAQEMVVKWQDSLQDYYSDQEIMTLFEQQVLAKIDKQVVGQISREAGASAVLIAVSPYALLDMLLVLWRNLKMINQVSRSYGIQTGYWARIKLIREMLHNIIYAGASELAADASAWALGSSLTAKLSTRMAQGLGAGVLTARMGVQAVRLCRPMPFINTPPPDIRQIASHALSQLKRVEPENPTDSDLR